MATRYHQGMHPTVAELIDRLSLIRRAARRAAAAEAGLSLAQMDALDYLGACNRFSNTPAAVAEYLDATRGTTSQSLRALERKGLVVRHDDAHDGRVTHLTPTAAGHALIAAMANGDLAGLGADGERLRRLLTEALRAAQRARGGRSFGRCATCRHLRGPAGTRRCGLTDEPLRDAETGQICVEHEAAAA